MEHPTQQQVSGTGAVVTVRRALISVWDKTGLDALATGMSSLGIELVATGGTAEALRRLAVPVTTVESLTGYPAILDGRVKTLHPAIFGAILGRDDPAHRAELDAMGIAPLDLVVVNLYPFETQGRSASPADAIELIDIGGVALLRAAAKNWDRVAVVSDPSQYGPVLDELQRGKGLSGQTRQRLAAAAFQRTAAYDATIAEYFTDHLGGFPDRLVLAYRKAANLRYGENPHQRAAVYREVTPAEGTLASARQHQGKELSFNNIADLDAAWGIIWEFDRPAAAIVKHATPCGIAVADHVVAAYTAARDSDPVSAFGGVVAFNREVDEPTARAMAELFTEAVIAPAYSPAALSAFARRSNLRVMECVPPLRSASVEMRSISGGLLVQDHDGVDLVEQDLRVVTPRQPSADEMADLRFAWKVCKGVKSNAIVLARGGATVGIGAGQPNRVGAVEIAVKGAGDRARGAVMASDGFFPFRDGVDAAARAGVTAVIQPGGSVRDQEVIAAANEQGVAMVLTGVRHFRH